MDFGEKLKVVIKKKYRTIGDCADKFGMNYTQLSQYLNGKKISIEFLSKVIEEFPDVDLNWLLRDNLDEEYMVNENQAGYKIPMKNEEIVDKTIELLTDLKLQLTQK
ncbi:hypothetical protein CJ739_120 [Mariniflexile rhizosphaerae]|uniref:helix-turn-helix domain-containing protein n=1 Tax=unclassified Mariniflexile TaxID=2643887 RepID=UPI000E33689A|nr:helix-turn-helix transcriptional regulator [Mariniflexile sp. TRM1-10]AXP79220.1 hypothetical protein CJ739_120 [Mariniflexile sp. TRM1-10]